MSDRILGVDPSLTCTGVALMQDGELLEWWRIRPKCKGDATERAMEIADEVLSIVCAAWCDIEAPPLHVVVETPAAKQHGRIGGRAQGIANYGLTVGIIYATVNYFVDAQADYHRLTCSHVAVNIWTKGKGKGSKDLRMTSAMLVFPEKYDQDDDPGGDVADAIWIAEWWRLTELWNQEEVGG